MQNRDNFMTSSHQDHLKPGPDLELYPDSPDLVYIILIRLLRSISGLGILISVCNIESKGGLTAFVR